MKKKIGVSISGLGVGKKHSEHISKNKSTVLVSVFDVDKLKQKQIQKRLGTKTSSSFVNMISSKDSKLVVIASPDHLHCKQIIQSFKKNKHIFVEKPICNNLSELNKIIKEWKRNNKKLKLQSNLILRSSPLFKWLKKKIHNRYFGDIFSVDAEYLYGRLEKFIHGWRGNSKDYSPINGGGVHMIDLVCWLINELPKDVVSTVSNLATKKFNLKSKDYMNATFTFKSGMILRVVANLACIYKHQHILKIYGTKKTFVYDDLGARVYDSRSVKKFKKINLKSLPSNKTNILEEFITKIKNNKNTKKLTEFDLKVMNAICYCNIAIKNSKKEKIKYII